MSEPGEGETEPVESEDSSFIEAETIPVGQAIGETQVGSVEFSIEGYQYTGAPPLHILMKECELVLPGKRRAAITSKRG